MEIAITGVKQVKSKSSLLKLIPRRSIWSRKKPDYFIGEDLRIVHVHKVPGSGNRAYLSPGKKFENARQILLAQVVRGFTTNEQHGTGVRFTGHSLVQPGGILRNFLQTDAPPEPNQVPKSD